MLMWVRAEEVGESECHPVMEWIRVTAKANIIRPEREQTSDGSFLTRKFVEPQKEKKQMNAGSNTLACAFSNSAVAWREINWSQAHRNVQRLQAHIVKATYL